MSLMDLGCLAHPEGDKCYQVTHDYRAHTIFVWARFHAEARRYGANRLDCDWDDVECERYKKLDHFEGDLLTWCLEQGWYFECSDCDQHTGIAEHGYPPGMVIAQGNVFCCQEHADRYTTFWAEKRALEKRFFDYAVTAFPDQEVSSVFVTVQGDGIVFFRTSHGTRLVPDSALPPLSPV